MSIDFQTKSAGFESGNAKDRLRGRALQVAAIVHTCMMEGVSYLHDKALFCSEAPIYNANPV